MGGGEESPDPSGDTLARVRGEGEKQDGWVRTDAPAERPIVSEERRGKPNTASHVFRVVDGLQDPDAGNGPTQKLEQAASEGVRQKLAAPDLVEHKQVSSLGIGEELHAGVFEDLGVPDRALGAALQKDVRDIPGTGYDGTWGPGRGGERKGPGTAVPVDETKADEAAGLPAQRPQLVQQQGGLSDPRRPFEEEVFRHPVLQLLVCGGKRRNWKQFLKAS